MVFARPVVRCRRPDLNSGFIASVNLLRWVVESRKLLYSAGRRLQTSLLLLLKEPLSNLLTNEKRGKAKSTNFTQFTFGDVFFCLLRSQPPDNTSAANYVPQFQSNNKPPHLYLAQQNDSVTDQKSVTDERDYNTYKPLLRKARIIVSIDCVFVPGCSASVAQLQTKTRTFTSHLQLFS